MSGMSSADIDTAANERAFPIPAADSVNIDRTASMILVRAQGKVWAFALSCPHEHAAVKWSAKDAKFLCTKHDSKYLPDGRYISGRATRHMDRFPIKKDGGNVIVTLDLVRSGDSVTVKILRIIPEEQKIGLSIKEAKVHIEKERAAEAEAEKNNNICVLKASRLK